MPILVDSNVILDIVQEDPVWGDWSDTELSRHQQAGLIVNSMIYAELCAGAATPSVVDAVLNKLKLEYQELSREALFLAAKTHLVYRRRDGSKTIGLPDFFIGAHAQVLGIAILTRDQGRYKTYFPDVPLICP